MIATLQCVMPPNASAAGALQNNDLLVVRRHTSPLHHTLLQVSLVGPLADAMGFAAAKAIALEAAKLAKADLATSTVMEMTALAGTMGRCVCYVFYLLRGITCVWHGWHDGQVLIVRLLHD